MRLPATFPEGVGTAEDSIGFLVDGISDVLTPKRGDLESPPSNLDQSEGRHMIGVCKTATDTVGILNPTSIVRSVVSGLDGADLQSGIQADEVQLEGQLNA